MECDFENGMMGWKGDGRIVEDRNFNKVCSLKKTGSDYRQITYTYTLPRNGTVQLHFRARAMPGGSGIEFHRKNRKNGGVLFSRVPLPATGEWVDVTQTTSDKKGEGPLECTVILSLQKGKGEIQLDDFTVTIDASTLPQSHDNKPVIPAITRPTASISGSDIPTHEPGLRGIVLAEGDVGRGTGFFANQNGETYIYSNAHVFSGNKAMKFTSVSGETVNWKTFEVSATADMVRFSLTGDYPAYEVMELVDQSVDLGDEVYVLGNSQGEGTITKLVGRVTGIGPEKIEVDAPFVSGNSGSPVIHASTGQVIGIATYAVRRKVDWTTEGTPFSSARRFAVRIDTATRWESPTWDRFVKEAQALRDFESTNLLLVCFIAWYYGDLEGPIEHYEDLLKQHRLQESQWLPEVRNSIWQVYGADQSERISENDRKRQYRRAIGLVEKASEDMKRYRKEHFCSWHQGEFLEHLKWRGEIRKSLP